MLLSELILHIRLVFFIIMFFRYLKKYLLRILTLVLLLVANANSKGNTASASSLPKIVSGIEYYIDNNSSSINDVQKHEASLFKPFLGYNLPVSQTLWLRIIIDNSIASVKDYYIHFNGRLDYVYLFQKNEKGEWTRKQSGILIPEKDKVVRGYINDKIPFTTSDSANTVIYIKIENAVSKSIILDDIKIIDADSLNQFLAQTKQIQSFFLGTVAILCLFNLLLFIFSGSPIYLYYMLYAFFSSVYFLFSYQYFETGFFANHPEVKIYLFFSAAFIPVVYSWFLYESLKTCVKRTTLTIVRKYAVTVSAFALLILVVGIFNFRLGVMIDDIYSIVNSVIIILMVVLLFRKVSNTVKIILSGSLFLITGVCLTIFLNFQREIPFHGYFFQIGFFIELIFFTIAINFNYQNERIEKLKVELKNTRLLNAKLYEQRKAQELRVQVQLKERDLATKAAVISQKETLIKNVTSQLEKQVHNNSVKIKDIKHVVSDLNSKLGSSFWEEFETHFIQVHPHFYKSLNEKFPGLTTNERRICAFLKLNLTTKEIANITKRNPESIHMTRSRLRKKMGLDKAENLENVIANIN